MNQYTLIPVSKNLSTLFFFRHFLFIILGKVNWKGVKELKFALLSVQVKMYLRNLLTRIWFFQKTVARKLTLKLFFSTVLCIAQVSNHLKYISSTKMSRKKLVLNFISHLHNKLKSLFRSWGLHVGNCFFRNCETPPKYLLSDFKMTIPFSSESIISVSQLQSIYLWL